MVHFRSSRWFTMFPDEWGILDEETLRAALAMPDDRFAAVVEALRLDNVEIFARRYGVGSLQIGYSRRDIGAVSLDDVLDAAKENIAAGLAYRELVTEHLDGVIFEYAQDGTYQREWFLRSEDTLFKITYECDLEYKDAERSEVDLIIKNLQLAEIR
ncbi:MAG: hypothetical protein PVJ42_09230 [bacterium]